MDRCSAYRFIASLKLLTLLKPPTASPLIPLPIIPNPPLDLARVIADMAANC